MIQPKLLLARLARLTGRVSRERRGNVLMLMAFSVVPLTLSTGMAIDYARAARLQTRLNAAADAAALAAVTQPMMRKDNATAKLAAQNMFNTQATGLTGLIYDSSADLTVTITGTVGASNTRTATVTYKALSTNAFAGVVGMQTIAIGGSSVADAEAAPNIDFYMMLDTSPSMLLPATSAGLSSMTAATGGCAFACHQTNTTYASDNTELLCNSQKKNCIDFFKVARNNNITLRTDLMHQAVKDLTDVATSTATTNGAKYRMGLFSFDYAYRRHWPTSASGGFYVDSNLSNVKNHVDDATILEYCKNNWRTCDANDNDQGTNFTAAFTGSLGSMPTAPGDGTNGSGDTPQAILFVITDGMRDEANGGRKLGPIPTSQCDTIKARGIRIAILYTEYLPASASDSWSISNVRDPYLSPTDRISPALISCASSGLFYKVTTDGDISSALASLFQKAVSTAHLTR